MIAALPTAEFRRFSRKPSSHFSSTYISCAKDRFSRQPLPLRAASGDFARETIHTLTVLGCGGIVAAPALSFGKELYRKKLRKDGEDFFVGSKAEKRSHTWCMACSDYAAADEIDEPERTIYFDTIP